MVRKLVTFMTVGLLVLTPIAANALGFGAIKLKSALNERLNAEVEVLSPTQEDIETLKVELASQAAFLRAGIDRSSIHNALLFEIVQSQGTHYIHISSKGAVREPFLNFLLEMSWKNGRMLREYTVLLDPPGRAPVQQQAPAAVEAPATAAPAAVEQAEAETTAQPFAPAPLAEPTPLAEPAPKADDAGCAQFPCAPITEYKESDAEVKKQQQAAAEEKLPELKHEPVMAEPEPLPEPTDTQPAETPAPLAEPSPLAEPAQGDMVAESGEQPFADDELFPLIPLTAYRESASGEPVPVTGELDYGITSKNDNLWTIASKMRPSEDVSIYQVMMAIQQANPDAFVDGNIHRLKVGQVLRIDDPSLFTAMSKQQAAQAYQEQTAQWENFRQSVAGDLTEQPVIATQVESETAVAEAEPKGELVLESPDGSQLASGAGVSEDAISDDIAALRAELDQMRQQARAAQGRNQTLNDRIADLEGQLEDMQRTISIKDNELAALQKQLSDAGSAPVETAQPEPMAEPVEEPAPVAEAPVEPAPVEEPVAEEPAEQPVAEAPVEEPVAEEPAVTEEPAAPAESPVAVAERIAQQEQTKQPAPAPATTKEESVMDTAMGMLGEAGKVVSGVAGGLGGNSMLLYIGGPAVLVLLILVLIIVKRRKQGENFQESILKGTAGATPEGAEIPSADLQASEESSFLSDFAVSGAGAIQTEDSEVDPLTEADVFMAYGRYEAAEERLQEAIQQEPDRNELKLKLLELYNSTKNTTAFESAAEDIYASLGGAAEGNPTWDKVVAMGKELVPNNPLFSGGGAAAPSAEAVPAEDTGMQMTDSQVMDIGLETGAFTTDEFSAVAEPAAEESLDDLDFNLDLGGESSAEEPATEQAGGMDFDLDLGGSETAEEETGGMDFDLDLGSMGGETEMSEEPTGEMETPSLDVSDAGLEFNLDMGATEEPTGEVEEPSLDFDLDLNMASAEETPATAAEEESDSTMMMDIGEGLDLDMDMADSSDESAVDLGLDAGDSADFDMAAEGDEVGTKLDLAKAYIDMGDPEGARSILDEVMDEGNEQQKSEAQQLIQQIA